MDSTTLYYLVIILFFVSMIVQAQVKRTYTAYSKVYASSGMTGREAAEKMLRDAGVQGVRIQISNGGLLSDHYDPTHQTLRLSEGVYHGNSVAALSVAAHEAGHALQHAANYKPLLLRSASVATVNIGSRLSVPLFLLGLLMSFTPLIHAGILLYAFVVFFSLVTLPVEFNASHRALAALEAGGMLTSSELPGAKAMLRSAAMTYVVSAVSAIVQLLRLIAIAKGGRRNDD